MILQSFAVCSPPSVFDSLPRPRANTETGDNHKRVLRRPSDLWGTHVFLGEVPRVKPHSQVDLSQTGGKAA